MRKCPKCGYCEEKSKKEYIVKKGLGEVIAGFKVLQGVDVEDRDWDKVYFGRYSKPAKELMILFKDNVDEVLNCMEGIAKGIEKMGRTWTPETIVKHAAIWRINKNEYSNS